MPPPCPAPSDLTLPCHSAFSTKISGLGGGFSVYAEQVNAVELAKRLGNLYLELLTPDEDGVFLLRASFLRGLYKGLEKSVDGASNLANGLADFLALESVRKKVDDSVSKMVTFLFTEQSADMGDHQAVSYSLGYGAAMKATAEFEQSIADSKKFSEDLGTLVASLAAEIAVEKGVFKVVTVVNILGKKIPILRIDPGKWTPAPGMDENTKSILGRANAQEPTRTAGTGGIQRLKVEEEFITTADGRGSAINVSYSGRLLPSMPRTRSKAIQKAWDDGASPPIAPNFNTRGPARKLKPSNFKVDGEPLPGEWHRAHTYGAGFGDEGAAGIWLARADVNLIIQNVITENIGRRLRRFAGDHDGLVEIDIETQSWPAELLPTSYQDELAKHPIGAFLRKAEYRYKVTTKHGQTGEVAVRFELHPPPDGRVNTFEVLEPEINNDMAGMLADEIIVDIEKARRRFEAIRSRDPG